MKQEPLRRHIVKIFDYALSLNEKESSKKVSKYFITNGGLGVLFGLFMKKDKQEQKKKKKKAKELFIKLNAEDI